MSEYDPERPLGQGFSWRDTWAFLHIALEDTCGRHADRVWAAFYSLTGLEQDDIPRQHWEDLALLVHEYGDKNSPGGWFKPWPIEDIDELVATIDGLEARDE